MPPFEERLEVEAGRLERVEATASIMIRGTGKHLKPSVEVFWYLEVEGSYNHAISSVRNHL